MSDPSDEKKLYCFNDNWTLEVDQLGYKPLSDRIKTLLYDAPSPFSVAVCGGWGSGKTSVLRYLMASTGGRLLRLDPETVFYRTTKANAVEAEDGTWKDLFPQDKDPLPSVWFNPWQHQFESHPLRALLHEIYNQFSVWGKAKEEVRKLSHVLLNTGLRLLKDLQIGPVKLGIDTDAIRKSGEAYEKRHYLDPLDSQRFSIAFEQAIAHLATAFKYRDVEEDWNADLDASARVLIFIDDLDRCQPEQAFKLLEAVKLFLNTKHCVFVFGIDYHRLVRELACEVKAFKGDSRQAGDYLDKMFQALVPLPLPKTDAFGTFISGLLSPDVEGEHDLLVSILERNPRKAKNFINSLVMRLLPGKDEHLRHRILMHYLRYYYPDVYRVLEKAPDTLTDLCLVCRGEKGQISNFFWFFENKMKNDLPVKPLLSGDESKQVSEAYGDLDNMDQHIDIFDCRQRFKRAFAEAFGSVPAGDIEKYF